MRDGRGVNRETSLKGVEGQSFRQRLLLFCIQLYAQDKLMIKKPVEIKKGKVSMLSKQLRYCSNKSWIFVSLMAILWAPCTMPELWKGSLGRGSRRHPRA